MTRGPDTQNSWVFGLHPSSGILEATEHDARGGVIAWDTMLQAGRSTVRVPDELHFFSFPNPSSRTMALGSTQPLTEISTTNFPGGKSGRRIGLRTLPPSVSRMSEKVGASTSKSLNGLNKDSFTLEHNVSEIGRFRPLVRKETPTQLGP
jgi:hypothetical protein